ncbi:MAG: winged helix-turn-helix transcriptional regulator [Caldilineales bacterium]|nr:winged helix-turn-helix transcriptional regulator [Caldilineales bacterium]MDW8318655.1 winged helix-turn-helix transcriptional regulator [Anaerolineae bacterium]
MGRKVDSNRLAEIADYVERHPHCKPIEIARHLNLQPSTVTRSLPALEDAGILLSEDDRGRLSLFGKRR